jgi:hypothetical protein
MIDRQYGEITFECDGCEETLATGERDWPEAMAEFRTAGWRSEKVGADWTHLCPPCGGRK